MHRRTFARPGLVRRTFARPAVALPAVLVTAALVAGSGAATASAGASTAHQGRASVRVYATNTHAAVAPSVVAPGIVHLRNIGRDELLVLQARTSNATRRRAVSDLRSDSLGKLLSDFRFLGESVPTLDDYLRLVHGTYYFVDVSTEHLTAGKVAVTTVEGARKDAVLPASHRLLVTRHKKLHVAYSLPKRTFLHVENRSSALTSFLFVGVAKRATYRSLQSLVAHPSLLKLFHFFSFDEVPLADLGPHRSAWMPFHAHAGRYIAVLIAIGHDANPVLHRGQVRIVHVR